jgi:transposase-like protein
MCADVPRREVVPVSILLLQPGESPRLKGEDQAHIVWLAQTEAPLPPILVDRRTMRVIDGMHRLMAASLKGQEVIDVEFFDGSAADAFLRGVEANVTHGLPLSSADRRAAAARIIVSHPQMSDRAIAETTGLAARTVASIRRRSTGAVPQSNTRVGRDGRVRPLSSTEGRRRAAELMAEDPGTSLREVARAAGVSPATARDVRRRLDRGEQPAPARSEAADAPDDGAQPGQEARPGPAWVLEELLRDPLLRRDEQGQRLLRLLQHNAVEAQELPGMVDAVPPESAATVVLLARQYAQMWLRLAEELDERDSGP